MKTVTTIVSISNTRIHSGSPINHHEAAQLAHVTVRALLKYWKAGLIKPLNDCQRFGIFFDEEAVYRIRKAESIRRSLQTNILSASVVLSLTEQIQSLKREVRFFRESR